ncbi:hypothetical protein PC114_g8711 [Phytophthora cactorum]|nr:hypothetical protein PC114_g8711 [Phytophthora cactorum]KAG3009346.1 hypothetical protein PC120_g15676 [Phytophthora cactorum]KAG3175344.1 hypothetical protein C6341_g9492 [Phytophthora cactorum]
MNCQLSSAGMFTFMPAVGLWQLPCWHALSTATFGALHRDQLERLMRGDNVSGADCSAEEDRPERRRAQPKRVRNAVAATEEWNDRAAAEFASKESVNLLTVKRLTRTSVFTSDRGC